MDFFRNSHLLRPDKDAVIYECSLLLAPATKNLVMSTSLLETALGSWCRVEGEARKLVTVSIAFTAALVIGSLGGVGK